MVLEHWPSTWSIRIYLDVHVYKIFSSVKMAKMNDVNRGHVLDVNTY